MAGPDTCEFTDQDFEEAVLGSEIPVLVDFWAEWCRPCAVLAPVIDELATENAGKLKVGKLDTDANRDVAVRYSISAIPTVILFSKGEIVEKFVGLRSKQEFQAAIDKVASAV